MYGLKPVPTSPYLPSRTFSGEFFQALKSCPDTKHFSKLALNRLTWTLVLQSSIKGHSLQSSYEWPEGRPLQRIPVFPRRARLQEKTRSAFGEEIWTADTGLENEVPRANESNPASALSEAIPDGGRGWNRTTNLSIKSRMLCQLSYASVKGRKAEC